MSLGPHVTSCHHFDSTCIDFQENRRANTPCQIPKTLFLRFIGREFGLVGLWLFDRTQ